MLDHVAWTDDAGVTHALVDDTHSEREPPYVLIALCDAGYHHHNHSAQIRKAARARAVTCFRCIEALFVGREPTTWPNSEEAPCCTFVGRAT